jgi:hypothetical protein
MSNVLTHRFVSAKLDGADLTQVQPSAWNDGHKFSGGATGQVLTRDTSDPTFGATWTSLAGYAPYSPYLFVNGVAQPADVYQVIASGALRQGNAVWFYAFLSLGPTPLPAGSWHIYLPYPIGPSAVHLGTGHMDTGSGSMPVWPYAYGSSDRAAILYLQPSGFLTFISGTTPVSATGARLEIRGSYQTT